MKKKGKQKFEWGIKRGRESDTLYPSNNSPIFRNTKPSNHRRKHYKCLYILHAAHVVVEVDFIFTFNVAALFSVFLASQHWQAREFCSTISIPVY